MNPNFESGPKGTNGSAKAIRKRLKKLQEEAVKNGELTDGFYPFKKFELAQDSKDSVEQALIYWEPTKESLESIVHLPANILRANLPEKYKNCSDKEIYEIMEQKIERNNAGRQLVWRKIAHSGQFSSKRVLVFWSNIYINLDEF